MAGKRAAYLLRRLVDAAFNRTNALARAIQAIAAPTEYAATTMPLLNARILTPGLRTPHQIAWNVGGWMGDVPRHLRQPRRLGPHARHGTTALRTVTYCPRTQAHRPRARRPLNRSRSFAAW